MWGVVLTAAFSASAVIGALTATLAYRNRAVVPAGTPLAVATAGIAGWSVAAAINAHQGDPDLALPLATVGVAGHALIVVGYLGLAEVFAGRPWRPRRRVLLLLGVEPVLVVVALATGVFFDGVHRAADGSWQPVFGVGYWLHYVYCYALTLSCAYRSLRYAYRRSAFTRRASCWLFVIAMPPIVVNLLAALVVKNNDLTLIGTVISSALAYGALTRNSIELLPIARAQLIDALADGVVVIDRDGCVADANEAGREMIIGTAPWIADPIGVHVDSIDPTFPLLTQVDADFVFASERLGLELEIRTRVIRDRTGSFAGWVMIARDVTQYREQHRALEAANDQLRRQIATIERLRADLAEQAVRDALTGLHNRRHLMSVLSDAERNHTGPLSVALIDVDHFKQVNDRYGHAAGDRVLVAVAHLLASAVRPCDVLARYGGEEFVLLLPGLTSDDAHTCVDRLRSIVAGTPLQVAGGSVRVSFSAGVACGDGPFAADALLEAADLALYAAKRNGRDRVELATSVS
ncbi:diguanylate cyclase [Cryptosporangium sp. NPDC048952]|uniref:histidine kinase N-terminal 7TM domain-containing diguanylate cyclase n=1 Tax=Cryptosporangium sp. NPDC048952 TaxID=3363961 RepID=UPI00372225B6